MGTWGHGSFENDNASDWVWGLKPVDKSIFGKPKSDPFAYPMDAINALLASDLFIDAPECDEAVAAAECIAAARGFPPANPPEEITAWLASLGRTKPSAEIIAHTKTAVEKVRNDEQSESRQLWAKANGGAPDQQWLTSLDDLLGRLSAHSSG